MKQWEVVVENLRQLRKDLNAPDVTAEEKIDIQSDIQGLKMRKNKLALKLGIRDEN
jgi:hypothetical protein